MKIAIVGNNDGPLVLLRSLKKEGLRPVAVGLQKPVSGELKNQYRNLTNYSDFFSDFEETKLLQELQKFEFDILINCFCNFLFTDLLNRYQVFNVHLSKLPKYRGRHPLHWALINGESEIGVSIHKMTRQFDAGKIYWQACQKIKEGLSVAEARSILMQLLENGFGKFIKNFEINIQNAKLNPKDQATYLPRRYPKDSRLEDWNNRDVIFRKVMALRSEANPAYLQTGNEKIQVFLAEKTTSRVGVPGKIIEILEEGLEIAGSAGNNIILRGFDPKPYKFKLKQQLR